VVVGDEDRLFVDPCLRIADAIPGATLRVIPDAAHSGQFENTGGWLEAVLPFLASRRPG
jgi:pimeloyl-ACP methyl ester carboxylesterase